MRRLCTWTRIIAVPHWPPSLSRQSSRFHPGNSCGLRPVIVTLSALLGSASPCLGGPGTCLWAIAVAAAAAVAVAVTANRRRQLPLLTTLLSLPPSQHRLPQTTSPPVACRLSTDPDSPSSSQKSALTWREQPHQLPSCQHLSPSASNPNPSRPVPSPLNDGKHPPATIDIAPLLDDASTPLYPVRGRRRHLHRITSRTHPSTGASTDLLRYLVGAAPRLLETAK